MKELIDNFMNEYFPHIHEQGRKVMRVDLEIIFMEGKMEGTKDVVLSLNK